MISWGLIFSGHNESDLRIKEAFPGVRRFVGVSFPRRVTELILAARRVIPYIVTMRTNGFITSG